MGTDGATACEAPLLSVAALITRKSYPGRIDSLDYPVAFWDNESIGPSCTVTDAPICTGLCIRTALAVSLTRILRVAPASVAALWRARAVLAVPLPFPADASEVGEAFGLSFPAPIGPSHRAPLA